MSSENKDEKLADVVTSKQQKLLPLNSSLRTDLKKNPGKPVTETGVKKANFVDILASVKSFVDKEFPVFEKEMRKCPK
jgi:hypothetical protein